MTDSARRVFSGIQPTGEVHLGNYLGAMKQWVEGQRNRVNFFCIVDLHALTVYQEPATLVHQTRSVAAMLLACGIDPKASTLFVQGHVAAHSEATWLLNCVTPIGWLERMTQFKEKSRNQESVSAGLLDYPVLQAADIMLYDAHEVPVGEDQKQHVELTRDIGERFNRLYGDTFVVPEPVIPEIGARVMRLDDPSAKMSKSYGHIQGQVRMLDDPKEIERSFMRAVTDSGNEIRFSADPAKAGVNNLLGIYKAVSGKSVAATERDFADARGYGDLKRRVAEVVIAALTPIRERHEQLMQDPAELDRQLAIGAEQARAYSTPKLEQIKRAMGLTTSESEFDEFHPVRHLINSFRLWIVSSTPIEVEEVNRDLLQMKTSHLPIESRALHGLVRDVLFESLLGPNQTESDLHQSSSMSTLNHFLTVHIDSRGGVQHLLFPLVARARTARLRSFLLCLAEPNFAKQIWEARGVLISGTGC